MTLSTIPARLLAPRRNLLIAAGCTVASWLLCALLQLAAANYFEFARVPRTEFAFQPLSVWYAVPVALGSYWALSQPRPYLYYFLCFVITIPYLPMVAWSGPTAQWNAVAPLANLRMAMPVVLFVVNAYFLRVAKALEVRETDASPV